MSRPPLETLGEFGQSLTLACAVDGSPAPDVSWYRDGVPLSETPNLRFSVLKNNDSLHISFMRQEDSGMFQCLASNEAGDVTAYTWLRVKSKLSQGAHSSRFRSRNSEKFNFGILTSKLIC